TCILAENPLYKPHHTTLCQSITNYLIKRNDNTLNQIHQDFHEAPLPAATDQISITIPENDPPEPITNMDGLTYWCRHDKIPYVISPVFTMLTEQQTRKGLKHAVELITK